MNIDNPIELQKSLGILPDVNASENSIYSENENNSHYSIKSTNKSEYNKNLLNNYVQNAQGSNKLGIVGGLDQTDFQLEGNNSNNINKMRAYPVHQMPLQINPNNNFSTFIPKNNATRYADDNRLMNNNSTYFTQAKGGMKRSRSTKNVNSWDLDEGIW